MDRFEKTLSAGFQELVRPHKRSRTFWRWIITISVVLLVVIFYLWARRHILYTSDAYVEANWVSISPEVAGHISRVFVEDHALVEAGDPLFEIDPDPYVYEVDRARGRLAEAIKLQEQLLNQLEAAGATIRRMEDQLAISKDVWERNQALVNEDWVSKERGVQYYYTMKQNEAAVLEAKYNLERIKAELGPVDQPFAQIVVAKADLERAQYNLNRTIIYAPTAGRVTDFYLRPGNYVEIGAPLFSLVDTSTWWVTARYKDYTLANMKVGDKAKIMIDMYWGKIIEGTVEGIGWGVNRHQASPMAAPSSLPYVEQTEFWIRLAQRFRVRIKINESDVDPNLRIGANCRVLITHSTESA